MNKTEFDKHQDWICIDDPKNQTSKFTVRVSKTNQSPFCRTFYPEHAVWIAKRLNEAAKMEREIKQLLDFLGTRKLLDDFLKFQDK